MLQINPLGSLHITSFHSFIHSFTYFHSVPMTVFISLTRSSRLTFEFVFVRYDLESSPTRAEMLQSEMAINILPVYTLRSFLT